MNVDLKKVTLKSIHSLKKFARYLGGDMSEDIHYFIKFSNKKPMLNTEEPDCSFTAKGFHVLNHGKEFLVVDHPNPISKREYEMLKELFEDQEENRSFKGVF